MTERENNVYKAKLAEQAERYDGEYEKRGEKNFFVSGAPSFGEGSSDIVVAWPALRQKLWKISTIYTAGDKKSSIY